MKRDDIHIIARNSNLSEKGIAKALVDNVYHDKGSWQKFLKLFFISLGVGFTVSGIVFFFAYNWADLHDYVKIGLTEGILIIATALALFLKVNDTVRNVILTAASVLVGVLFAVFGQVYQTGANAYDFFLAWTIFVTLWVLVSDFAPLWLLYLVLINTTFILYSEQVANDWPEILVLTLLFAFNAMVLIAALLFVQKKIPNWFLNTVALAAVSFATIGMVNGIFSPYQPAFAILIVVTIVSFALGIWYGLTTQSGFYLSIISFSLIIMVSALLIKISNEEVMLLVISLFIIASVTLTIKKLVDLQKKWKNEE